MHLLVCLALLLMPLAARAATPPRPNIVLILVDDMGWSDVGAYGSEIPTPNIDSLASQGIRFTQFYNTSKCHPSRSCLLTGLYAQQTGIDVNPVSMRNAVTLGEVMRTAGYRTFMSGKHHGTDNPYQRGFDRYYGLRDGACNHFNPGLQRPGEGVPAKKQTARWWAVDGDEFQTDNPAKQHHFPADFYTTDYFTRYALEHLESTRGDERPFFLYLAYTAPHDPMHAWPEDIARYETNYTVGFEVIRQARYQRQVASGLIDPAVFPLSAPSHPDWQTLAPTEQAVQARRMAVYAAMIDRLDRRIGEVLAKLDDLGKRANTLILFCSDNGGSAENVDRGDQTAPIGDLTRWASVRGDWANVSNTPFRRWKNYSHEGGICTPLIACWPAGIARPNRVSHRPGHFSDFMATFIELSGAVYPREFRGETITPLEGKSFAAVLRDETPPPRAPIFWKWSSGSAARDGDWKIVRWGTGAWELYDLAADRTETNNLTAARPEIVTALSAQWTAWERRATQRSPLARDDSALVPFEGSVSVSILANDSDADGQLVPGTVQVVRPPDHGAFAVDPATGAIGYTHNGSAATRDSLAYVVQDDDGAPSQAATVSFAINQPGLPAASDDGAVVLPGQAVGIAVLLNDRASDGYLAPETVTITAPPQTGSAIVNPLTGVIVYTHDGGPATVDALTYTVADHRGNVSNPAEVSITVTPPSAGKHTNEIRLTGPWHTGSAPPTVGVPSISDRNSDSFLWGTGAESGGSSARRGMLWTYFPEQSLAQDGDAITVSLVTRFPLAPSGLGGNGQRFGLFHHGDSTRLMDIPDQNRAPEFAASDGYFALWNLAAPGASGESGLRVRTIDNELPLSTTDAPHLAGSPRANFGAGATAANTPYPLSFNVRQNSPTEFAVESAYHNQSMSATASAPFATATFNTFYFLNTPQAGLDSLEVSNVLLTVVTVATSGPPNAIRLAPRHFPENLPVGTEIGVLAVDDPDAGDTFTFALVDGTGADDNRRFQISSNRLFTAELFDFEIRAQYSIRLEVTDGVGGRFSQALTLEVADRTDEDTDGDRMPDWWELAGELDMFQDDSAGDADRDGASNLAEWVAGTRPRDANSRLLIRGFAIDQGEALIEWDSVPGRSYRVEHSATVSGGTWTEVGTVIADANVSTVRHSQPPGGANRFYRVLVQ